MPDLIAHPYSDVSAPNAVAICSQIVSYYISPKQDKRTSHALASKIHLPGASCILQKLHEVTAYIA